MSMNQTFTATATLEELLSFDNEKFIYVAYNVLLGREPDSEGMCYYLERIRIGKSKFEILAQLLFSKEGKSRLVNIVGLNESIRRHKLLSTPLIGPLLQVVGVTQTWHGTLQNSNPFVNITLQKIRKGFQAFWRGETYYSKILSQGYLRFHLDNPRLRLLKYVRDSYKVAGWAVDIVDGLAVKVRVVIGHEVYEPTPWQREDVQREFAHICKLPLATGFTCMLKLPLGIHRMRIEVEGIDGSWIPVRKVLLFRIPGKWVARSRKPKHSYREWSRLEEKQRNNEIPIINRNIEAMVDKPAFTVVIDTRQGHSGLKDTIQSIQRQSYPHWDIRVITEETAPHLSGEVKVLHDMSLADIQGNFIILMKSGQRFASNALYEFSAAINQHPDMDLIYADEDTVNTWGNRSLPFHKPGWSPDYLETFNYIGFVACYRSSIARDCFDKPSLYNLVLKFTERTTRVLHLAKVLGHNSKRHWIPQAESAKTVRQDIAALSDRLQRTGRHGVVSEHPLHKGCYDISLDLKHNPLVSIVIPTAGKTVIVGDRYIDLIVNVIEQIHSLSTYKNIEIIIVDNGNLSPTQLRFLTDSKCTLITYTNPIFNIAQKLNLGVSLAKGELLLLMNDDIEILTPSWIERLLEQFEKPHVGVVGVKLVYPNHNTQHVGVVQPFGNPDHVRRGFARNDAGYFYSTCGVRNYTAVTGAVMMVKANVYKEVGGYSEELAVCFNDVDFCMKVGSKGLTVVYTPCAELIHMESLSRVAELDMSELAWFHQRWATELVKDKYYNDKFLTVEPPTFVPCIN